MLTTILGSCVALCLWDPVRGAGGRNHFLLPEGKAEGDGADHQRDAAHPGRHGQPPVDRHELYDER